MAHLHEIIDRRSLAMHSQVAARLHAQPSLLGIARANLERWLGRMDPDDPAIPAVLEWQQILDSLSLNELCELLVREDEEANRLRQNSPFAGVLSPAEVWEIKRRFSSE